MANDAVRRRKAEHLVVAARSESEVLATARWSEIHLLHNSLPEIDRSAIDMSVHFLGRRFRFPILITGMTGGHEDAYQVNLALARAAQYFGIPMGVGSQRAMLVDPTLAPTYSIAREAARDVFLLANIGLPQLLSQGDSPPIGNTQVSRIIRSIEANALAVHLNFLQESIQPGGDTNARGGIEALSELISELDVPVVVKETGAGMSTSVARRLVSTGVAALEVGGSGGTSFAAVEGQRAANAGNVELAALGQLFANWGIPTPAAIRMVRDAGLPLIATGGIRSGLDAARALALGADLVGIGRPLLHCALESEKSVVEWLNAFIEELRTAMFLVGAPTTEALKKASYVSLGTTRTWLHEADKFATTPQ